MEKKSYGLKWKSRENVGTKMGFIPFIFLGFFFFFKSINIENFQKDKNILFWVLFYFSWGLHKL